MSDDLPASLKADSPRIPPILHVGAEIAALTVVVRRLVEKAVSLDAKDRADLEQIAAHVHSLCQADLQHVRFMNDKHAEDQRGIASNLIDKVFVLPRPQ